jgi:hypothetical protein
MRKMKVRITLTEPMLGTKSANEELFTKFIAAKRPEGVAVDEAEAEARLNQECDDREKSMTCFHRTDDGTPMLWDYQVKGFFKDACGALRGVQKTESGKLKAYKKIIDGQIFVDERRIPLVLPEGGEIGICERPCRASAWRSRNRRACRRAPRSRSRSRCSITTSRTWCASGSTTAPCAELDSGAIPAWAGSSGRRSSSKGLAGQGIGTAPRGQSYDLQSEGKARRSKARQGLGKETL